MDELISRRAAIDALAKNMPSLTTPDGCGEFDHDIQVTDEAYVDCMQIIHELPSAQPELIEREAYIRGFEQGKTQGRLDTLSAQPETHEERTETHACDYINRKDAIDAHYEYCNKHPDAGFPVWSLKILEDLPSAQPVAKDIDVPIKDCISRQTAIRIVDSIDTWQAGWRGDAIESMKALPSAQPEMIREIRKWINSGNRGSADYFIVEKIEEIINKYE